MQYSRALVASDPRLQDFSDEYPQFDKPYKTCQRCSALKTSNFCARLQTRPPSPFQDFSPPRRRLSAQSKECGCPTVANTALETGTGGRVQNDIVDNIASSLSLINQDSPEILASESVKSLKGSIIGVKDDSSKTNMFGMVPTTDEPYWDETEDFFKDIQGILDNTDPEPAPTSLVQWPDLSKKFSPETKALRITSQTVFPTDNEIKGKKQHNVKIEIKEGGTLDKDTQLDVISQPSTISKVGLSSQKLSSKSSLTPSKSSLKKSGSQIEAKKSVTSKGGSISKIPSKIPSAIKSPSQIKESTEEIAMEPSLQSLPPTEEVDEAFEEIIGPPCKDLPPCKKNVANPEMVKNIRCLCDTKKETPRSSRVSIVEPDKLPPQVPKEKQKCSCKSKETPSTSSRVSIVEPEKTPSQTSKEFKCSCKAKGTAPSSLKVLEVEEMPLEPPQIILEAPKETPMDTVKTVVEPVPKKIPKVASKIIVEKIPEKPPGSSKISLKSSPPKTPVGSSKADLKNSDTCSCKSYNSADSNETTSPQNSIKLTGPDQDLCSCRSISDAGTPRRLSKSGKSGSLLRTVLEKRASNLSKPASVTKAASVVRSTVVVDQGAVQNGQADQGATENVQPEQGVAENGKAEEGAAENGKAEEGAADQGAADQGAADQGAAENGKPDEGAAETCEPVECEADEKANQEKAVQEKTSRTSKESSCICSTDLAISERPSEMVRGILNSVGPLAGSEISLKKPVDIAEQSKELVRSIINALGPLASVISIKPAEAPDTSQEIVRNILQELQVDVVPSEVALPTSVCLCPKRTSITTAMEQSLKQSGLMATPRTKELAESIMDSIDRELPEKIKKMNLKIPITPIPKSKQSDKPCSCKKDITGTGEGVDKVCVCRKQLESIPWKMGVSTEPPKTEKVCICKEDNADQTGKVGPPGQTHPCPPSCRKEICPNFDVKKPNMKLTGRRRDCFNKKLRNAKPRPGPGICKHAPCIFPICDRQAQPMLCQKCFELQQETLEICPAENIEDEYYLTPTYPTPFTCGVPGPDKKLQTQTIQIRNEQTDTSNLIPCDYCETESQITTKPPVYTGPMDPCACEEVFGDDLEDWIKRKVEQGDELCNCQPAKQSSKIRFSLTDQENDVEEFQPPLMDTPSQTLTNPPQSLDEDLENWLGKKAEQGLGLCSCQPLKQSSKLRSLTDQIDVESVRNISNQALPKSDVFGDDEDWKKKRKPCGCRTKKQNSNLRFSLTEESPQPEDIEASYDPSIRHSSNQTLPQPPGGSENWSNRNISCPCGPKKQNSRLPTSLIDQRSTQIDDIGSTYEPSVRDISHQTLTEPLDDEVEDLGKRKPCQGMATCPCPPKKQMSKTNFSQTDQRSRQIDDITSSYEPSVVKFSKQILAKPNGDEDWSEKPKSKITFSQADQRVYQEDYMDDPLEPSIRNISHQTFTTPDGDDLKDQTKKISCPCGPKKQNSKMPFSQTDQRIYQEDYMYDPPEPFARDASHQTIKQLDCDDLEDRAKSKIKCPCPPKKQNSKMPFSQTDQRIYQEDYMDDPYEPSVRNVSHQTVTQPDADENWDRTKADLIRCLCGPKKQNPFSQMDQKIYEPSLRNISNQVVPNPPDDNEDWAGEICDLSRCTCGPKKQNSKMPFSQTDQRINEPSLRNISNQVVTKPPDCIEDWGDEKCDLNRCTCEPNTQNSKMPLSQTDQRIYEPSARDISNQILPEPPNDDDLEDWVAREADLIRCTCEPRKQNSKIRFSQTDQMIYEPSLRNMSNQIVTEPNDDLKDWGKCDLSRCTCGPKKQNSKMPFSQTDQRIYEPSLRNISNQIVPELPNEDEIEDWVNRKADAIRCACGPKKQNSKMPFSQTDQRIYEPSLRHISNQIIPEPPELEDWVDRDDSIRCKCDPIKQNAKHFSVINQIGSQTEDLDAPIEPSMKNISNQTFSKPRNYLRKPNPTCPTQKNCPWVASDCPFEVSPRQPSSKDEIFGVEVESSRCPYQTLSRMASGGNININQKAFNSLQYEPLKPKYCFNRLGSKRKRRTKLPNEMVKTWIEEAHIVPPKLNTTQYNSVELAQMVSRYVVPPFDKSIHCSKKRPCPINPFHRHCPEKKHKVPRPVLGESVKTGAPSGAPSNSSSWASHSYQTETNYMRVDRRKFKFWSNQFRQNI